MQRTVDESFEDVDGVLFVLAADEEIGGGDRFIASRIYGRGVPVVVALNKVDRIATTVCSRRSRPPPPSATSASCTRSALGRVQACLRFTKRSWDSCRKARRTSPRVKSPTCRSRRVLAELVREQALDLTREEVPHAITSEVDEIEEARVRVLVYVETESQKGIVVGKGGSMIREIGSRARPEIERLLGRRVFLELAVKVKPRWRRDESLLERLGI